MCNIQVSDSKPEAVPSKALKDKLNAFCVEHERYAAGLALAKVPDEAIETLRVKFGRGHLLGTSVYYDNRRHTVNVKTNTNGDKGVADYNTTWDFDPSDRSSVINYGLAATAHRIGEYYRPTQDVIDLKRSNIGAGADFLLGASMYAGALVGSGVFEAAGWPTTIGTAVGGFVALGVTATGVFAHNVYREDGLSMEEVYEINERMDMRAEEFTSRQDVQDAFRGLVKLEVIV
ncbi:MAG TPA: hypothetical protein VIH90_07095 [Candidatus Saccharimonadales bacterium]